MAKLTFCLGMIALLAFGFSDAEVISSPPITDWGIWAKDFDRCPEGTFAQGFQLKVENWMGTPPLDDTALNGVRLFCGNPADGGAPTVTSNFGDWGKWRTKFRCNYQGYVTGFQLRVEKPGFVRDETASNNMRIFCTKNEDYIEGDGLGFGDWQEPSHCSGNKVVCGIKTQVQKDRGILLDDTALNNIALECCDLPNPAKN